MPERSESNLQRPEVLHEVLLNGESLHAYLVSNIEYNSSSANSSCRLVYFYIVPERLWEEYVDLHSSYIDFVKCLPSDQVVDFSFFLMALRCRPVELEGFCDMELVSFVYDFIRDRDVNLFNVASDVLTVGDVLSCVKFVKEDTCVVERLDGTFNGSSSGVWDRLEEDSPQGSDLRAKVREAYQFLLSDVCDFYYSGRGKVVPDDSNYRLGTTKVGIEMNINGNSQPTPHSAEGSAFEIATIVSKMMPVPVNFPVEDQNCSTNSAWLHGSF